MKKRILSMLLTLSMLVGIMAMTAVPSSAAHPFTDVPEWATEYVNEVYEKGIMNGTGGTTFGSNQTLTREQLVVTLYRISGSTVTGTLDSLKVTFADAADISDWAWGAVEWASKEGITAGVKQGDDLYFKPKNDVTRQEAAKFFITFIDYMKLDAPTDNTANLKDMDTVADWALPYVERCIAAGIINGDGNGNFDPTGKTVRIAAAKMLACLPEASSQSVIFPDLQKASKDKNDPTPSNLGLLPTNGVNLVEDFKISQAIVMDDAEPGNQLTVTGTSVHGWHETRIVRNEYGTYIVITQDEDVLETGTYLNQYTYAITRSNFMIVHVTKDGFTPVYTGYFNMSGNCAPNILCGNDGMIYVVNIMIDDVSYFHSDLLEYNAYLAVHEFDTKTNTAKGKYEAVVPFENPDPDAFQIDGVPRVGVMNADKQHPVIDNVNNTIHACFGAGGNFGTGYVSWFNYDIETHTWENKNYNGEIPQGANRFEYFNLFADGKGGIFGIGNRTGTPEQMQILYKNLYNADIKFNLKGYMWDAIYLFAIPDVHKEEVIIIDRVYEPDYTNEKDFPRNPAGMITPADACTYDGGCTYMASNGYFYVFYSSQGDNYYAIYDTQNNFKQVRMSKKLNFKNTSVPSSHYQVAVAENTNGDMYLMAIDASLTNAEIELYKLDVTKSNILIPMSVDANGKIAAIPMKIKNNPAKLSHGRLSATTSRSLSIQDNVLCIITAMNLGDNRSTTLNKIVNGDHLNPVINGVEIDAFQSTGGSTDNYLFYSIELPH